MRRGTTCHLRIDPAYARRKSIATLSKVARSEHADLTSARPATLGHLGRCRVPSPRGPNGSRRRGCRPQAKPDRRGQKCRFQEGEYGTQEASQRVSGAFGLLSGVPRAVPRLQASFAAQTRGRDVVSNSCRFEGYHIGLREGSERVTTIPEVG